MSVVEILVVVVGALAGYWLVNFFLRSPVTQKGAGAQPKATAQAVESEGAPPAPWFVVLGVDEEAGIDEIRQAYQRLLSQYHPDKVASLGPELQELAHRKSQEIMQAYRAGQLARGSTL